MKRGRYGAADARKGEEGGRDEHCGATPEPVAHDARHGNATNGSDESATNIPTLLHYVKLELCHHVIDGTRDYGRVVAEKQSA